MSGEVRGRVEVTEETREDAVLHGFWEQCTSTLIDMEIVNLDARYYLLLAPKTVISKEEAEEKAKYLQKFLENRPHFTLLV